MSTWDSSKRYKSEAEYNPSNSGPASSYFYIISSKLHAYCIMALYLLEYMPIMFLNSPQITQECALLMYYTFLNLAMFTYDDWWAKFTFCQSDNQTHFLKPYLDSQHNSNFTFMSNIIQLSYIEIEMQNFPPCNKRQFLFG